MQPTRTRHTEYKAFVDNLGAAELLRREHRTGGFDHDPTGLAIAARPQSAALWNLRRHPDLRAHDIAEVRMMLRRISEIEERRDLC